MNVKPASQDKPPAPNIKSDQGPYKRKRPKKITASYLYNSGLAYLQRFPTSVSHFRKVMGRKIDNSCKEHPEQEKTVCAALLEDTITEFMRIGLLDDQAYLQGMIHSLQRRGLSRQALFFKLQQKGFGQSEIQEKMATLNPEANPEDNEYVAALRFLRKKRKGGFAALDKTDETDNRKTLAAMARAGFSYHMAQKALETSREDAEIALLTD